MLDSKTTQKQHLNREMLVDALSEKHLMLTLWAWIFSL